jgi:hypothetical protein
MIRAALLLVLVFVAAFLVFGVWAGSSSHLALGISQGGHVGLDQARARGTVLGEKAAAAAKDIATGVDDATLTAKIKAKMALDDSVRARTIDVTTDGSIVTLTGTVRSGAEKDRARTLARETVGVTEVVDHLDISR